MAGREDESFNQGWSNKGTFRLICSFDLSSLLASFVTGWLVKKLNVKRMNQRISLRAC